MSCFSRTLLCLSLEADLWSSYTLPFATRGLPFHTQIPPALVSGHAYFAWVDMKKKEETVTKKVGKLARSSSIALAEGSRNIVRRSSKVGVQLRHSHTWPQQAWGLGPTPVSPAKVAPEDPSGSSKRLQAVAESPSGDGGDASCACLLQ